MTEGNEDGSKDTAIEDGNKDSAVEDGNKDAAVEDGSKDSAVEGGNKDAAVEDGNKDSAIDSADDAEPVEPEEFQAHPSAHPPGTTRPHRRACDRTAEPRKRQGPIRVSKSARRRGWRAI